jgi:hypothetical protein
MVMARRGQCRCGLVLTFHRTAQGYKVRCPSCGAVVRLRVPGQQPPPLAANEIDVELVPVPVPDEASPPESPEPWRSWLWLMILAGVVVLGMAGGLVWWFFFR